MKWAPPDTRDRRPRSTTRLPGNSGTRVKRLGLGHDIRTAWRRGPRVWGDVLIAIWELALANRAFRRTPTGELPLLPRDTGGEPRPALTAAQQGLVERVAYAVPIMGLRVPWRADCVVQALAARRWLARGGIGSNVHIGVRNDDQGFQAHAWLRVGERVVTGGDISAYAELPPSRIDRGLFAR